MKGRIPSFLLIGVGLAAVLSPRHAQAATAEIVIDAGQPLGEARPRAKTGDPTVAGKWRVIDASRNTIADSKLTRSGNAVSVTYPRQGVVILLNEDVDLAKMKELHFSARSEQAVSLALGIEDKDKAAFHAAVQLAAGEKREVRLGPADFQLNEDSPVKKAAVEPKRLKKGFALIDFGGEGSNILTIEEVRVVR